MGSKKKMGSKTFVTNLSYQSMGKMIQNLKDNCDKVILISKFAVIKDFLSIKQILITEIPKRSSRISRKKSQRKAKYSSKCD